MARVDRVLTMPGGSLLLAGRSGVGRRTAVTLVTFMHQMTLVTPKVSRGYGMKHFKNDLKTVSKTRPILKFEVVDFFVPTETGRVTIQNCFLGNRATFDHLLKDKRETVV